MICCTSNINFKKCIEIIKDMNLRLKYLIRETKWTRINKSKYLLWMYQFETSITSQQCKKTFKVVNVNLRN